MIKQLSIIIPCLNEEENVQNLISEINKSLSNVEIEFEIILVDDFSKNKLIDFVQIENNIQIIRNNKNMGQSQSIRNGLIKAKYGYVCTLDGDGQNPPSEIIKLINELNLNFHEVDAVVGYRYKRKDKFTKKIVSKIANFIIRKLTKTNFKDIGCSLKIFKREDADAFIFSGDIHRIFNILLSKKGLNVREIAVEHLPRIKGKSNYSLSRTLPVLIDSLLILITNGFQKSSRYVLGRISVFFFSVSLIFLLTAVYQKYTIGRYIFENPLFLIFLVSLFTSIQLFISIIITFYLENAQKDK